MQASQRNRKWPPGLRGVAVRLIRRGAAVARRAAAWLEPGLPQGWVEVERVGLHWRLNPSQSYVDREIVLHGSFEPRSHDWWCRLVRPGMRVVDVGANFGFYALAAAVRVGDKGKVWAVEPEPSYLARLREHVRSNGFESRIQVVPYALSDRKGQAKLAMEDSTATFHPVGLQPAESGEVVECALASELVGSVLPQRFDLMKIDIDGHEPCFLRGGREWIETNQPIVLMEMCQSSLDAAGSSVEKLKSQIEEMGFGLWSERLERPFASRQEFLFECGNPRASVNVWAVPEGVDLLKCFQE